MRVLLKCTFIYQLVIALFGFHQTQSLTKATSTKDINSRDPDTYCDIGGCECAETVVKCQLKDCTDAGLQFTGFVSVDNATHPNNCTMKARTKYNSLFVPRLRLEFMTSYVKQSEFTMEICLQTPETLKRKEVSYNGKILYEKLNGADADIDFQNSHHLWELKHVSMSDSGELSAQLLLDLDELKELELTVTCMSGAFVMSYDLLHTLSTLETLRFHMSGATPAPNLNAAHFRDLRKVKTLRLDDNRLRILATDIFMPLQELQHLNLSQNALETLPADLLLAQLKLRTLDLSYNRLKSLPLGLFKSTTMLGVLLLAHNQFSVPNNILEHAQIYHLSQLDLSYNYLRTLHGAGLYENKTILMQSVHKSYDYYNALGIYVNISHNIISELNLDWFEHVANCYYTYDLSHNNIKRVMFLRQPQMPRCLRKWLLGNNPLQCDCQLAWLTNNSYQFDISDWRCALPTHLSERALNTLSGSALCNFAPAWCPHKCACSYDSTALSINCTDAQLSEVPSIPRPEQVGLSGATLYLNNNKLYELPLNTSFGYTQVTRLYAAYNQLTRVQPTRLPPNLTVLDVRGNKLEHLSNDFLLTYMESNKRLQELYISANPWICDCAAELLLRVVSTQRKRLPDADAALCVNLPNVTLSDVNFTDICDTNSSRGKYLQLALVLTIAITMLISIWLYSHNILQCCIEVESLDSDKIFDAFISYAHQQQHYVNDVLLPELEQGDPPFRICTHERNWLAGAYIPEQIIESVEQSRRTILVLSDDFVASDWARMEFRMAHQCALNERRARIIIIKYGELTDVSSLDKELQAYLKMNTYLEFYDPRFWQKLRYALPHKSGVGSKSNELEKRKRVNFIGEEKIILRGS
ncbi:protein toll-like isoform X2 [Zeugodacus cucurbitae]|uniref:protein toll-like isoform X2 n=1 Tax=Zeugodacus cucurbitae TaxID=28588 RepID=UPI0023D938A3|nr:protein toll-like isoform X2 [Zeugodacus cucurbitae]